MEGSELSVFHIRALMSSEVKYSVESFYKSLHSSTNLLQETYHFFQISTTSQQACQFLLPLSWPEEAKGIVLHPQY